MYIPIEDGKKICMPRYFKEKLYHENQRQAIAFWQKRKAENDIEKKLASGNIITAEARKRQVDAAYTRMYSDAEKDRNIV